MSCLMRLWRKIRARIKPEKAAVYSPSKAYPNVLDVRWTAENFWLQIEHDGNVDWDTMQDIKNDYFGRNVTCVEVYPAAGDVINNGNYRHLWRMPNMAEFC